MKILGCIWWLREQGPCGSFTPTFLGTRGVNTAGNPESLWPAHLTTIYTALVGSALAFSSALAETPPCRRCAGFFSLKPFPSRDSFHVDARTDEQSAAGLLPRLY